MKRRAVFLDRDGTLNELVLNPSTQKYEAPHHRKDLRVFPYTLDALKRLQEDGYLFFIVSNQPDYALGKATLEETYEIARDFMALLRQNQIKVEKDFYCYHHPQAARPELAIACNCRKPNPGSLVEAANEYDLDLAGSWMIGDQDSDIECGQVAGCQTVLIQNPHSQDKRGNCKPTASVQNLNDAADIILRR